MLAKEECEEWTNSQEKHIERDTRERNEPDQEIIDMSRNGVEVVDYMYVVTPHDGIVMRVITDNPRRSDFGLHGTKDRHDIAYTYNDYGGWKFRIVQGRKQSVVRDVLSRVESRFDNKKDMLSVCLY